MTKYIFIILVLFSCKKEDKKNVEEKNITKLSKTEFVEEKSIKEFPKTEFIPTLEHNFDKNKNSVYCVTLLYAWDEIRKQLDNKISIDANYKDLNLLNSSKSFKNVLDKPDYEIITKIGDHTIEANAKFKKSLPFETKFNSFDNKLEFDKVNVKSFGLENFSSEESNQVKILYYKNDDDFIIKLLPKDTLHEIIIMKSSQVLNSMAEMNNLVMNLIEIGKKEKDNSSLNWKYNLADEDIVVIPKFNFNIKADFDKIIGSKLKSGVRNLEVFAAWQKNAFILDESGAEIESEAVIAICDSAGPPRIIEKPKPKKMILDKPFLLFMQKKGSNFPYFGLWSANSELMIK